MFWTELHCLKKEVYQVPQKIRTPFQPELICVTVAQFRSIYSEVSITPCILDSLKKHKVPESNFILCNQLLIKKPQWALRSWEKSPTKKCPGWFKWRFSSVNLPAAHSCTCFCLLFFLSFRMFLHDPITTKTRAHKPKTVPYCPCLNPLCAIFFV